MASSQIYSILCRITTGNVSGAGGDGRVFLGVGGREFRLHADNIDNYEKGSSHLFILGAELDITVPVVHVRAKDWNDPRVGFRFFLQEGTAPDPAPVYIRYEAQDFDDNWNLEAVGVWVYNAEKKEVAQYHSPTMSDFWLGQSSGNMLYLKKGPSGEHK